MNRRDVRLGFSDLRPAGNTWRRWGYFRAGTN